MIVMEISAGAIFGIGVAVGIIAGISGFITWAVLVSKKKHKGE